MPVGGSFSTGWRREVNGVNVPPDALYPARFSRPDLLVPGAPGAGWSRRMIGLDEPRFGEVSRRIDRLVVLAAVGALAGELLVDATARPFVLAMAAGIGGYSGSSSACATWRCGSASSTAGGQD